MDGETNTQVPIDAQMTPEMIEKFNKLLELEEKKKAYNREYMRKLRMDKEKRNKLEREYRLRKKQELEALTN